VFLRQYCANGALTSDGKPAGGIVGFLSAIKNAVNITNPKMVIVVWEGSKGSERKRQLFKEYKQKRKPPKLNRFYEGIDSAENKGWQVLTSIELLKCVPICQLSINSTEADDVIGLIAKYKFKNEQTVIMSNDKDFYQLLNETTQIYSPSKKIFITHKTVLEEYKISPENFCLAKTIAGDTSDNINGVRGAGFISIAKRIPMLYETTPKTIGDVIAFCEAKNEEKKTLQIFKNIASNEDLLRRNWKLMHLDTYILTPQQIKQVNYIIDSFEPALDKIGFVRKLIEEKLDSFKFENFWFIINYLKNTSI